MQIFIPTQIPNHSSLLLIQVLASVVLLLEVLLLEVLFELPVIFLFPLFFLVVCSSLRLEIIHIIKLATRRITTQNVKFASTL